MSSVEHSEDQMVQVVLAATRRMWNPWLRMLLRRGVHYCALLPLLKEWFLQAAEQELQDHQQSVTASALSVLSGVHRKDVRQWLQGNTFSATKGGLSLASQVWTYWIYAHELPECLPRRGAAPSFEQLVWQFSQDVHAHTVLQALERMGLVELVLGEPEDQVRRLGLEFIPPSGSAESWSLLADSLSDHMSAGLHNLEPSAVFDKQGAMLEHSVFADALSLESIVELEQWVRQQWKSMQAELVHLATRRWREDQQRPLAERTLRLRVGMYSYRGKIEQDLHHE